MECKLLIVNTGPLEVLIIKVFQCNVWFSMIPDVIEMDSDSNDSSPISIIIIIKNKKVTQIFLVSTQPQQIIA